MRRLIHKLKNKGFTLVEVLVAAAILSLVVPPILSSFVTIARVNSKSRMKLSATTIANGVMEAVKGFDLLEISKETNFPGTGNANFHVIPSFGGTAEEVNASLSPTTTKSVASSSSGYEFKPNAAGEYYFLYKGVALDGTHYDVLLTYKKKTNNDWEKIKVTDGENEVDATAKEVLEPLSVRVMKYYDVDIKVVKSGSGFDGAVLAHIQGTKADFN